MHGGRELVFHESEMVNKDQMNGTINEAAGRAKRQVAEWTGDKEAQIEGLAQEVKGKTQKVWGNVKHAARSAAEDAREKLGSNRTNPISRGK